MSCLLSFCFWAIYSDLTSDVGHDMHRDLIVFGQVVSGCNKYYVKRPVF